jgi:hypothetical protein
VIWSDSDGNEFYNGLELGVTKRQGRNLTFGAGWTWARDLTGTQDSGDGASFAGQVIQNQFDRSVEYANNALVLNIASSGTRCTYCHLARAGTSSAIPILG